MTCLCSFLALAFTAVAAADVAPQATPQKAPEIVQEAERGFASLQIGALQEAVDALSNRTTNKTKFEEQVRNFLHQADGGAAKEKDILHSIKSAQEAEKTSLKALGSDAKQAAQLFKSAARQAEEVSQHTGASEQDYEEAYRAAEHESEQMEERAEHLSKEGEHLAETLFVSIEKEVKEAFRKATTDEKAEETNEKTQEAQEEYLAWEKAQERAEKKQEAQQKEAAKKQEEEEAEEKKREAAKKEQQNSATPAPPSSPPTPQPAPPPAPPSPPSPQGGKTTGAGAAKAQTLAALPAWSKRAFAWLAWFVGALATVVAVWVHFGRPKSTINSSPLLG